MTREPITPWQEPEIPPPRPLQFSLRTLFLGMLTVCLVLGIGYSTSAAAGSAAVGIRWACLAALVAWAVWATYVFRSARISFTTTIIWLVLVLVLVVPSFPVEYPNGDRRGQCRNNMLQITLALWNYENEYGSLPPAYTVDAQGNRLHSWRTLILPPLEYRKAYQSINWNQPWDAPANQQTTAFVPEIYQCPSHPDNGKKPFTSYVAVIGPNTMWPGERGRTFAEVSDGTANTIVLIEITRTDIHWAEPRDLTLEEVLAAFRAGELTGISSYHSGGQNITTAGGRARTLNLEQLDEAQLRALFTVAGGEDLEKP